MAMTEDDFEYWLANMHDALEEFFSTLPPEVRQRLDYSIDSLDVLENWLLDQYKSPEELLEPSASDTLGGVARYLGQTIRKNVGGKWRIRLDNPKYIYYRIPELGDFAEKSTPVAPHTLVTTAADRRTGTLWSELLRTLASRYGKK